MSFLFKRWMLVVALAVMVASATLANAQPRIQGNLDAQLIGELGQASGGAVTISRHSETGKVRFVGAPRSQPISLSPGLAAPASPAIAAGAFLAKYGTLFGLSDASRDLRVSETHAVEGGRSVVKYQQVHNGVPVFAGELNVNLDGANNLLSIGGEVVPDLKVSTTPKVTAAAARDTALTLVARSAGVGRAQLS